MAKAKKTDVSVWVPSTPIRLKVVAEGWGMDEIGCPHCKSYKLDALSLIVRTAEGVDIWWLCNCGMGDTIEEKYKATPGEHRASLGYYLNCAWKMQEGVWPTAKEFRIRCQSSATNESE